jgi:hypothetical protein
VRDGAYGVAEDESVGLDEDLFYDIRQQPDCLKENGLELFVIRLARGHSGQHISQNLLKDE